ncbi:MAG: hypothetical protein ACK4RG_07825, partial [Fimbriimonadales bacterium]
RDSLTPVLIGSAVTALFVLLCVGSVRGLGLGHVGLALATSVAATVQMVGMLQALTRRIPPAEGAAPRPLVGFLLRSGLATLLMGMFGYALHTGLHTLLRGVQPNLQSLMVGALVAAASMSVYLWLCKRMGVREAEYVQRVLRRRVGTP